VTTVSGALEGLVLGLSASGHCLAVCVPALAPLVVVRSETGGRPWRDVLLFLGGRALGYVAVGAVFLAVGSAADWEGLGARLAGVSMIVLGLLVGLYAVRANLPELRMCSLLSRWRFPEACPVLFGLLVGLSPCPPLLLLGVSLAQAGPGLAAAGLGVAFLVGTSAPLLAVALLGLARVASRISGVVRASAAVAGLWFAARGVAALAH